MATASSDFKLAPDDVHIWCTTLRQPAHVVEMLLGLLSGDEMAQSGRYRFENLQQSYIVSRGVLRVLLAAYMEFPACDLEFTYKPAGKPQLSDRYKRKVSFNLSHSNDLVLYAFRSKGEVGVDIEYIRPLEDLIFIAERNFSKHELTELKKAPPDKVTDVFFSCWTRKESYIKATGDGISFPLQEFDVSLQPDEPAKLLSIRGSTQEARRWSMVELFPAAGYAAALVVEGNVRNVVFREWNGLDHFINR
jgi:4'-phosphopantetheinyl transferase